ncbi:aldo/keto reductase [Rhodospirillum rubrum]|uniref:Aldo/keto reductase n=1 Tax=Rhodospirillum rubrum (strain ATCC 11170 / ATH 1.1.1 / DSM 467 / LMG 4362 / NCIMB 8255 / S1) TaxID=269796 RepID=Q2RVI5_RHORT|nr:aldo/keto reductase [Rhodospirillum rubrum]ABC21860.1 Aldo/keto reductase [Rhodospirillum rubrum ATCC 11170]AEO47562.1 aldo/keto reductase [Rhodospirillum rubrum F11]MBK5953424.1 aldo/keto reductase [Rhodospirillum rubrum]QXG81521.1 aldo/keto reductase [Rhodospirillum rubrum]HAQ01309.1 aldo/keto reductase [Rhodospirillum rubrum]
MDSLPLGSSGLRCSALGLGCMGMSEFYGPSDDARSLATLEAAVEQGITLFDTADMYGAGHNETLLGGFLKGRRDKVVLATKFAIVRPTAAYARTIDNSPAYVRSACEASLRRLGIDTIDLYYVHRRNPQTPLEDTLGALAELKAEGKIRAVGLSEVSAQTLRAAHAILPIAAVQSEYSLWTRDAEAEVLAACAELGITFVAYSPLGRAALTGAITPTTLVEGDFRRAMPRFGAEAWAVNRPLVEALGDFASARGATPAQVALAWLLGRPQPLVPIFGTRSPERLRENIGAAALRLSADDRAILDALFPPGIAQGMRYTEEGMKNLDV